MSRIHSTEPTEYRTSTDRDYPDFAVKIRKVSALVEPPLSPTEQDQFVERWGAFLRANDVVREAHALELFNGILQTRTKKDPDVMNIDAPSLYLRQRNVQAAAAWLQPPRVDSMCMGD